VPFRFRNQHLGRVGPAVAFHSSGQDQLVVVLHFASTVSRRALQCNAVAITTNNPAHGNKVRVIIIHVTVHGWLARHGVARHGLAVITECHDPGASKANQVLEALRSCALRTTGTLQA
jgi:hypothetical protein